MIQAPYRLGSFRKIIPKGAFFDRPAVIAALSPSMLKFLRYSGNLIKKIAQNSMKRKPYGAIAPPGSPPFAHAGDLKEKLFAAYDATTNSAVVGPLAFANSSGMPVTALHEYGGMKKLKKVYKGVRVGRYPPRPYMGPALDVFVETQLEKVLRESMKLNGR